MTPFEKVMVVAKQAEMLIESVQHNWGYVWGKGATYSGSFKGLTPEAAYELGSLFDDAGINAELSDLIVLVECPITAEESTWINRKRGYRG